MLDLMTLRSVTQSIKMFGKLNARLRYHYGHETISVNSWEFDKFCMQAQSIGKIPLWNENRLFEKKLATFDFFQAVSVEVSTDNGKTWKAVMWTRTLEFRANRIEFNTRNSTLSIWCHTMIGPCEYVYYFNTDKTLIPSLRNEELKDQYSYKGLFAEEFFLETST